MSDDTPQTIAWIDGHRIEIEVENKDYRDSETTTEELMAQIEAKLSELKTEVENE